MALIRATGMDSTNGQFRTANAGEAHEVNGLSGKSTAPVVTLQTAAGTGASVSIVGNNVSGKITLTTGVSLLSTGKVLTLTLADGLTFANGAFALFSPADANFAGVYSKLYAIGSTTGADLYVALTALSVSTVYTGTYLIVGY